MNKIIIVEDDPAVRDSLGVMLEVNGYTVEAYDNGGEFLRHLDRQDDGVLLLDLQLPDINGEEVIVALTERGKTIPVIVMTGGANSAAKQRARDRGAVTVLDKPVDNSLLLETINRLL